MPLTIHCYRHGESAANAGAATSDPALIPLTELGHQQAQALAATINTMPDLLVVSPFLRAQQTAVPLQQRYPQTQVVSWPVQEFTYLSPAKSAGTTAAQRRPRVQAYWATAEVMYEDGDGAESFFAFMQRVVATRQQLEALHHSDTKSVVMVGHGQFWQALRAVLTGQLQPVDAQAMLAFRALEDTQPLHNAQGFSVVFDGQRWQLR
jgi:probable phosphoglycerate mutase